MAVETVGGGFRTGECTITVEAKVEAEPKEGNRLEGLAGVGGFKKRSPLATEVAFRFGAGDGIEAGDGGGAANVKDIDGDGDGGSNTDKADPETFRFSG
mmetsp:Transcript_91931/g.192228  ORF Transcript_91931/g.192228 Transcript_91931/m.192228 type:complete len:99 (-) Transcript_91931:540-836(-)